MKRKTAVIGSAKLPEQAKKFPLFFQYKKLFLYSGTALIVLVILFIFVLIPQISGEKFMESEVKKENFALKTSVISESGEDFGRFMITDTETGEVMYDSGKSWLVSDLKSVVWSDGFDFIVNTKSEGKVTFRYMAGIWQKQKTN